MNKAIIAVSPSLKTPGADAPKIEEISPASNWAIVAAIIIAAMPHLWQWIGGYTKARNNLTETLLQKLSDSYQLSSASSDSFRKMIEDIAEKPTELAEKNALNLRDMQGEIADIRGQLQRQERKIDFICGHITKEAQSK
jgi:hypothetical protein